MTHSCHVCGGELAGEDSATCSLCGRRFHLAWSQGSPTPNCGRPWFRDDGAMGFVCHLCAQHQTSPQPG